MSSSMPGYLLRGIAVFALMGTSAFAHAGTPYAEDRALIEDLQARYLFALDFRDAEAYANTFTDDGVLDYGAGQIKGRKAIRDMVTAMKLRDREQRAKDPMELRPAAGRHSITNIVLRVDGNHAVGAAYWHHMSNANPERKAGLDSFGHYEDELVKVKGEWLFARRKIYNEQIAEWIAGDENPVSHPGPGPKLRKPAAAAP